jgi:hypothetical protein
VSSHLGSPGATLAFQLAVGCPCDEAARTIDCVLAQQMVAPGLNASPFQKFSIGNCGEVTGAGAVTGTTIGTPAWGFGDRGYRRQVTRWALGRPQLQSTSGRSLPLAAASGVHRSHPLFMNILLITIPPLIVFLFFNRHIVAGLTAGAVKG